MAIQITVSISEDRELGFSPLERRVLDAIGGSAGTLVTPTLTAEPEWPPAEEKPKPKPKPKAKPKTEEPKAEEPKAEEPKAEELKAEEPKAEEPKAEEPKAEELNDVQAAIDKATEFVNSGKTADVKAALTEVGAKRVSELKGADIGKFLDALGAK